MRKWSVLVHNKSFCLDSYADYQSKVSIPNQSEEGNHIPFRTKSNHFTRSSRSSA